MLNTLDWEADDPVELVADWDDDTLTIRKVDDGDD